MGVNVIDRATGDPNSGNDVYLPAVKCRYCVTSLENSAGKPWRWWGVPTGKSTIASLITRFYDIIDEGQYPDGWSRFRQNTPWPLRNQVALVSKRASV